VADVHGVLGCPPPVAVGGVGERVLAALEGEMHVGEIAEVLSVAVEELLPRLMEMELANLVEKRPGNYYKKLSAPGG
jgi:predicted Rossmann fold nucleotide-binding protein DprA/Smf involved in DNA uptake